MLPAVRESFERKATALSLSIENGLDRLMQAWLLVAGLACGVRLLFAPANVTAATPATLAPYVLLILAPFASLVLALRWFADAERMPQPTTRLAVAGRWRAISISEAKRNPLYGTGGIMVSLLVGMLLNVPVRALEYLAAVPPLATAAPGWLITLHGMMTLDVVLFTSLYTVAFVAALRRVPLFPRLLAVIWVADVAMQVLIADFVASEPALPSKVAEALPRLLEGNIDKVVISAGLWLPYLLLSRRVNVTYRHRIPA